MVAAGDLGGRTGSRCYRRDVELAGNCLVYFPESVRAGPGKVRVAEQQAAAIGRRVATECPAVGAEFAAFRVVVEAVVPDFCGCLLQIDRRLADLRSRRCCGQHC